MVFPQNGTLLLHKVLQSDAGIYTCTVTGMNTLVHHRQVAGSRGGSRNAFASHYEEGTKGKDASVDSMSRGIGGRKNSSLKTASGSFQIRVMGE